MGGDTIINCREQNPYSEADSGSVAKKVLDFGESENSVPSLELILRHLNSVQPLTLYLSFILLLFYRLLLGLSNDFFSSVSPTIIL
jgi:hypothetical protein